MRFCVYTALIGDYEELNEQPVAKNSNIPFICFTDSETLSSNSWEIRKVSTLFGMDPIRSQRDIKIRPHRFLDDYDVSIYIDNSILLTETPEKILETYKDNLPFCLSYHSFRYNIIDEFLTIIKFALDDPMRVLEQLNHYTMLHPEVLKTRPLWGGFLLRDHHDPLVREMGERWAAHVNRYSRRDQLSISACFAECGLDPKVIAIDNYKSWFHSWPHAPKRDQNKGPRNTILSYLPPDARQRQLEIMLHEQGQKFTELQGKHQELLAKHLALLQSLPPVGQAPAAPGQQAASGNDRRLPTIHVDPADNYGRDLVQRRGSADDGALPFWSGLLSGQDWTCVIDAGAGYGDFLLAVPPRAGMKIIALEPNPIIRPYLKRTLAEAGIPAEIAPLALSDRTKDASLQIDRQWSGASHLVEAEDGGPVRAPGVTPVKAVALSHLLAEIGTDSSSRVLVRIGAEAGWDAILRGGRDAVTKLGEIAFLIDLPRLLDGSLETLDGFTFRLFELGSNRQIPASPQNMEELRAILGCGAFHEGYALLIPKKS